MKLTQSHIQQLYKFTRKHYVEYYDVQSELVDHLANDIEEILVEKPKLTFEQARDTSFKKFGIFGFMNVVDQKKNQMNKKYFKIIFKFVKEWFRLPKIILTLGLIFGFYKLQMLPNAYSIYNIIFCIIFVLQITFMFIKAKKLNKKENNTQKKWLFEHVIQSQGFGNGALMLFYTYQFFLPNSTKDFIAMGDFRRLFSAFLITFLIIFGYITLVVVPKKAEKILEETYPEYKFI